tara:strand:- start:239 stop:388 length:150 start_codon:yes stop_codon:yes gene_type:complete
MSEDKVVDFPKTTEIDQQFLELEKQKVLIREQLKEILGVQESFTERNWK